MANSKVYPMPADVAALTAKIAAEGGPQLDPTQPTGKASGRTALGDITLGWSISHGIITITIVSKSWALPASQIWQHVDALFAS